MKLPPNINVKAYGAEALVELTPEVRDLLTREDKFGGKYCMYRQDQPGQKYVYVPRGLVDRSKAEAVQVSYRPVETLTPSSPPQTEDQAQVIEASLSLLNQGVDHLIEAPTGFGKCALHGETVVMFDGSVKEVQDVIVGDLLMGPDSNPRKVLALGSGVTQAHALHTVKGETLRFNEDHILSLRCCGGGDYGQAGDLIEVSIKDYMTWPKSKKHEYKLWKPDCIQFVSSGRLPVDPYLVGAMLGDGGFTQYPTFHSVDEPLLDVIRDKLHFYGSELRFRSGCSYGIVGGNALIYFRALELDRCHGRDKFIPAPYLTASVKDRLQLLAGLLDTDGHLVKRTVFEYVTQSVKLASDFERLCWSLGFACTKKQVQKTCQYKGNAVGGLYWRLHVSGATHTIPTVLARKRAKVREQKKNVHNHGFTVEDLGQQPYYGFHLTEDCLYLTGNYFVTHNTYVGAVVAGKLAQKTLIVVTKNDLTTSWRETLTKFMGQTPGNIGHVQQNVLKYETCQFTIAMIHTLVEREYDQKFYESFGLIIFDESVAPNTLVTTSKGAIPIIDLVRNKIECEALSFNTQSNEYEWKPITAYHEHPPRNPLMRITHEHGYVDCTNEHPFYTDRGWVPVRELEVGDNLYLDTIHSKHYNNSKQQELKSGIVATGDYPWGLKFKGEQDTNKGLDSSGPLFSAKTAGYGEVRAVKTLGANPTKGAPKPWVGGYYDSIRYYATRVVSPLLPCKLFSRGETDTRAIDCTARPTGVVGLVDDGRRDLHCGVSGLGFEQVSRAGREGVVRPIYAEGLRQLRSGVTRLVHYLFSGGQQIVEAGTNAVLPTEYAVQVGGGSLGGKNLPVQSMWCRHPLLSRSKEGSLLQERGVSEGEKVHELPPSVHSSIGTGETKSCYMGPKTRVLSVTPLPEPDLVYDIEVADNHNFVANGVVVHNCHRLGAEYFAQACSKFNAAHRLGLSATPERSDGKQDLFQAHIGPVMVKGKWVPMSPKVLVKKTGFKLPMSWQRSDTGQWIKAPMKVVPGRMTPVTKVLADDYNRNQEIVKFVKSAYDAGRNTVIMSDLLDGHLIPLFHLLVKAGIPGEHIGYYHGQVKKENLEASKLKRVVLATYLMCGEGTNVVQWDTLVLATPRSNVKQPIGRIMRFAEGKKTPVVLELIDDNEVLKAFHFSRLKQYYSVKAEIVNM